MFLKFYPEKKNDANEFADKLCSEYTPAELESHFIKHRKKCSSEAIDIKKDHLNTVMKEYDFYS